MNETFAFLLKNLEPSTNYIITVVACTSFCSPSSDSLTLRTKIGVPGAMFQPKLRNVDDKIVINWEAPKVLGGNLDYFQLKLIPSNLKPKVYRINGRSRSCVIEGLQCEKDKIDIIMRSVNIESSIENKSSNRTVNCLATPEPIEGFLAGRYHGEWSPPISFDCQPSISATMVVGSAILLLITILMAFMLNKAYKTYQKMKDIHIVWPKGLDPNSPLSSPTKTYDAVRDLDLLKDHVLTDIEEEEEVLEREKFITEELNQEKPLDNIQNRESTKSEVLMPFICNPKTNEIFYQLPKLSKEKVKSAPSTPVKATGYADFTSDPNIDLSTGYTKMFLPNKPRTESISTSVEGYLDMSGKSAVQSPLKAPRDTNYTLNEIKMFIQDSEMKNNGYIGKRASILNDSVKKQPPCVNSNGYVGLHN